MLTPMIEKDAKIVFQTEHAAVVLRVREKETSVRLYMSSMTSGNGSQIILTEKTVHTNEEGELLNGNYVLLGRVYVYRAQPLTLYKTVCIANAVARVDKGGRSMLSYIHPKGELLGGLCSSVSEVPGFVESLVARGIDMAKEATRVLNNMHERYGRIMEEDAHEECLFANIMDGLRNLVQKNQEAICP